MQQLLNVRRLLMLLKCNLWVIVDVINLSYNRKGKLIIFLCRDRGLYVWAIFSINNKHNFCIYHESYLGIFVVNFYQIPYLGNRVFSKLGVIQKYTQIPNTLSQVSCCVVIDVTTRYFQWFNCFI